ncbi:MAG: hypothetical protein ACRD0Y_08665 [Terriglobales bacterium]
MPCLICDLRPEAATLLEEYRALQSAGEAVALFWPAASIVPGLRIASAQQLQECFENEQVAFLAGSSLPDWLSPDEFHRVLLIGAAAVLQPEERALADLLLAHGAEEVEVLTPAGAADLAQSWASGRPTGGVVLR